MACQGTIRIGAPYLLEEAGYCRLTADVTVNEDRAFSFYFEFDACHRPFVCSERGDAFLLVVLAWAMQKSYDIFCEAPITRQLYYQLVNHQIKDMAYAIDEFDEIEIHAELGEEILPTLDGVGTGFSAGVDSFYTTLTYMTPANGCNQLTHLFFCNIGALSQNKSLANRIFEEKKVQFAHVAEELGLSFVSINTNALDCFSVDDGIYANEPIFLRNAACVYALKKMLICYYESAGCTPDLLSYRFESASYYDVVTAANLSVKHLRFYETGSSVSRLDKVKYIANNDIVRKYLSVCAGKNDSLCNKCTRTMLELYAIGELDSFCQVFDVGYFRNNLANRIGYSIGDKAEWDHKYVSDSLREAKKNSIPIPKAAFAWGLLYWRPLLFLKKVLRGNEKLKAIWHKYNMKSKLKLSDFQAEEESPASENSHSS